MNKATGIVIHGDELARRHLEEQKENEQREKDGKPPLTEEEEG